MDPIFSIISLLLFAAIALTAWLLVYWVLHDPLPRAENFDPEQPPTARKERPP